MESVKTGNLICPRCGMVQRDWDLASGVNKGESLYCCQGCADNTGCTCAHKYSPRH